MPKKSTRNHFVGDDHYVSCPGCKQTLPIKYFNVSVSKNKNSHNQKHIKSYCKQCSRKREKTYKSKTTPEYGRWIKVNETKEIDVVKKYCEINAVDFNEFRKWELVGTVHGVRLKIDTDIVARYVDDHWEIKQFCGFGFVSGSGKIDIYNAKVNARIKKKKSEEKAEDPDILTHKDLIEINEKLDAYLEKIGKRLTKQEAFKLINNIGYKSHMESKKRGPSWIL